MTIGHIRQDNSRRIRRHYSKHIENPGGIFTPAARRRLISLAEKPRAGTSENDFWYNIRTQVRNALIDLRMICDIASDDQLKQMFSPLSKEDYEDESLAVAKREDLKTFLFSLLNSHGKTVIDKEELWRYKVAVDVASEGLGYFFQKEGYTSKLYHRSFEEMLDAISTRKYEEE